MCLTDSSWFKSRFDIKNKVSLKVFKDLSSNFKEKNSRSRIFLIVMTLKIRGNSVASIHFHHYMLCIQYRACIVIVNMISLVLSAEISILKAPKYKTIIMSVSWHTAKAILDRFCSNFHQTCIF